MAYGDDLKAARLAKQLTPDELGKLVRVSPGTIRNLERGRIGEPQMRTRKKLDQFIREALSRRADDRRPSSQQPSPPAVSPAREATHDEPREHRGRWVPIEAILGAGYKGEAGDAKDESHFLLNSQDPARRCKVIRLFGDSMYPELRSGDLLLVDPKAPFANGAMAAIRVKGNDMVKKVYRVGEGRLRLEPINPEYKAEELPASEVTIVGLITDLVERKMR